MRFSCKNEHSSCFNYDNSESPMIEVVKMAEGEENNTLLNTNEIVFVMEGRILFNSYDYQPHEAVKGEALFFPIGINRSWHVLTQAVIVIFRLYLPVVLCDNCSIEKLYKIKEIDLANDGELTYKLFDSFDVTLTNGDKPTIKQFGSLEFNSQLRRFIDGITDYISTGQKCRSLFEMKVREFFLLLRAYYTKQNIYYFLLPMLNNDSLFSEYILRNWRKFSSIAEMAESLHITPKYFSTRFVSIFGKTPSRWINENRALIISREITSTKKIFKQIALENGFSSDALFTRFCKKFLGKTPTDIRKEA